MMDAFISTFCYKVGTWPLRYRGCRHLWTDCTNVSDLNGDGLAELILTNETDLFVFNADGQLLWQVAGAGGYDVIAGRWTMIQRSRLHNQRQCRRRQHTRCPVGAQRRVWVASKAGAFTGEN